MTRETKQMPSRLALAAIFIGLCLLLIAASGRMPNARDAVFFQAGFLGLTAGPCLALFYLWRINPARHLPFRAASLALLFLMSLSLLLWAWNPGIVKALLQIFERRFQHPSWHHLGLVLAAAVYLPLMASALRHKWRQRAVADLVVAGGALLFIIALYLPSGIHSVAHWESWIYRAFLEGQFSWTTFYELTTRFWVALPHLLGMLIAPDSFAGFHVVNALMLWGKLLLLYAILRRLGFPRLFACLSALLCLIYPVNSDLLSLRSLPNQFSVLAFLAAAYLMLEFRGAPSRLRLLGIWLALTFNVVSNETAYALILFAPLFWILPKPRSQSKSLNLTLIWLLFPAIKMAHLLLLSSLKLSFYNSYVFDGANATAIDISALGQAMSRIIDVYKRSFVDGWAEAFDSLVAEPRLGTCILSLIIMGAVLFCLWRDAADEPPTEKLKQTVLLSLLFMLPAVGVLIWLPGYAGDSSWRMYFYVPIGAAVALVCLFFLLTLRVRNAKLRSAIIVVICLLLALPAVNRLLLQREKLTERAGGKARMLYAMLEIAPKLKDETLILMTTSMTDAEFAASDVSEMRVSGGLDDSMLYTLYGDGKPANSVFCMAPDNCRVFGDERTIFSKGMAAELLPRTLVLVIHADLSVTLIDDPATYFDLPVAVAYDASRLVDADAPLPPRAHSMLGAAP